MNLGDLSSEDEVQGPRIVSRAKAATALQQKRRVKKVSKQQEVPVPTTETSIQSAVDVIATDDGVPDASEDAAG
jgi:hypothetical protein